MIKNDKNLSHSISGWIVRDKAGHIYKFGNLRLGAGNQAIIHTGDGTSYTTSASTHLYWGREWYVWNNTGDKVIPATRGRLFEGHLLLQRRRQQEVLLKGIQTALPELPLTATSIKHPATLMMSTNKIFCS